MLGLSTTDERTQEPPINCLRDSIQANRIHFPVPVPVFPYQYRADIQWRLVELYFVRGWSTKRLAERYGVTTRRIAQSLQHWVCRAMELGYLQAIPPEPALATTFRTALPQAYTIPETRPFMPIPASVPSGASVHSA
jgi:hypothetical protein